MTTKPLYDLKPGYEVTASNGGNVYARVQCATWAEALTALAAMEARHPHLCVWAFNQDNVDIDCRDGLTDEERHEIEEL